MIGLVVQLAILLQIFGGRRGDDVLHMSYMHAKLEHQPTDQDDHVNSVGPSPATLIKFTMLMNKVYFGSIAGIFRSCTMYNLTTALIMLEQWFVSLQHQHMS